MLKCETFTDIFLYFYGASLCDWFWSELTLTWFVFACFSLSVVHAAVGSGAEAEAEAEAFQLRRQQQLRGGRPEVGSLQHHKVRSSSDAAFDDIYHHLLSISLSQSQWLHLLSSWPFLLFSLEVLFVSFLYNQSGFINYLMSLFICKTGFLMLI